ncbi:MAG: LrgB family protein, partial [Candidatus Ornithospirochaeta sp.]
MNDFVSFSAFFGIVISLASYFLGMSLKKRIKSPLCSPLLISIILTILFLIITKTEVSAYRESADIITWFLTPATVSLALPLYLEIEKL